MSRMFGGSWHNINLDPFQPAPHHTEELGKLHLPAFHMWLEKILHFVYKAVNRPSPHSPTAQHLYPKPQQNAHTPDSIQSSRPNDLQSQVSILCMEFF